MSNQLQLTFDFTESERKGKQPTGSLPYSPSEWTEADRMDAAQAAADIYSEYRERKIADNHIDPNRGSYEAELRRVPGSNFKGKD